MNWHEALETQMDTHKFHLSSPGVSWTALFFTSLVQSHLKESLAGIMLDQRESLWRGDTVYLTGDMLEVILQAAHDLPEEQCVATQEMLLSPFGFVQFEEPIIGKDRHGMGIVISSLSWAYNPAGVQFPDEDRPRGVIQMYFYSAMDDERDEVNQRLKEDLAAAEAKGENTNGLWWPPHLLSHYFPLFEGMPVLEMTDRFDWAQDGAAVVKEMVKFFFAFHYISHQTIGERDPRPAPRATRRRAERWNPEGDHYISVITLRRKSVKGDEGTGTKLTARHIVTGHWRRQWYPSLGKHQPKYIHEYVKGPEDGPLRIRDRRIFNFAR